MPSIGEVAVNQTPKNMMRFNCCQTDATLCELDYTSFNSSRMTRVVVVILFEHHTAHKSNDPPIVFQVLASTGQPKRVKTPAVALLPFCDFYNH